MTTGRPPEPAFAEPWHAQLFALTVHLNEAGRFAWPDWAARFGATLKQHGLAHELDGGDDYFNAWLETLEALLAEDGGAPAGEAAQVRAAWESAYLATPHGQPVRLATDTEGNAGSARAGQFVDELSCDLSNKSPASRR